ncbi:MAG: hypothetical protein JRH11_05355 [Deltaproteobacteria bacterium]|nr:hypothetical protein [Deltaproteobacteria bacterium]
MNAYEVLDPNLLAIVGVLEGCAGLFVGLLFVVVGFVKVRSAHATAGYLVGGAGVLSMLAACCTSWQEPAVTWLELYEVAGAVGGLSSALALLSYLGSFGLIIAGGAVLARHITGQKNDGAAPVGGL